MKWNWQIIAIIVFLVLALGIAYYFLVPNKMKEKEIDPETLKMRGIISSEQYYEWKRKHYKQWFEENYKIKGSEANKWVNAKLEQLYPGKFNKYGFGSLEPMQAELDAAIKKATDEIVRDAQTALEYENASAQELKKAAAWLRLWP